MQIVLFLVKCPVCEKNNIEILDLDSLTDECFHCNHSDNKDKFVKIRQLTSKEYRNYMDILHENPGSAFPGFISKKMLERDFDFKASCDENKQKERVFLESL
jgi:hypothetical protein